MGRLALAVFAAVGLAVLAGSEAAVQGGQRGNEAQPPAAEPSRGVALTALSVSVSDLARSVAFYRTAFGLETFAAAVPLPSTNAAMAGLVNAGAAKYRQAAFRVPHTGVILRLMELSGVERAAQKPGLGDPGQVRPRFVVSDMTVALASLKLAGAELVSTGEPAGASKTPTQVVARDPDGYLIEIERDDYLQSMAMTDVTPVVGLHVGLTTADTDRKLAFYKDVLGFEIGAGAWGKMPSGVGEFKRSTSAELGGANRLLDVVEYRDVGRVMPARGRVQDPATGLVSFIVRDLAAALSAVKQANLRVVTAGETPVALGHLEARRIVVQDPDGAFIELIEE